MKKSTKFLVSYSVITTLLAVLSIYQVLVLLDAQNVVYAKNDTPVVCLSLTEQLEKRAYEIREDNKSMDLEKYRQEAIREVNLELQASLADSPYIDYDELEEKYGY